MSTDRERSTAERIFVPDFEMSPLVWFHKGRCHSNVSFVQLQGIRKVNAPIGPYVNLGKISIEE
jgi:hypothetical protein